MKLLLISLFFFGQFMDFKDFENLIGKEVSYANQILLEEGFEYNYLLGINSYTLHNTYKKFYEMPYNIVSIITDEKSVVKSVTIHFHKVIDDNFYNSFILYYGNPDTIQVIESQSFVGEWTKSDDKNEHKVRKGTLKMREGKFEENPLFMLWNKKNYQIKVLLRHQQKISEITFRLSTDKF